MQQDFKYPKTAEDVTAEMLAMSPEELEKVSRYPLYIHETRDDLYKWIARLMADELKENNAKGEPTRWVLPIGPKGQYPLACQDLQRGAYQLEERVGIPHGRVPRLAGPSHFLR